MNGDDDHNADASPDGDGAARPVWIGRRLHRMHGSALDRIRVLAGSDAGTTEGRVGSGGRPATAVFASILDPAIEVRVVATNIPLERLVQFSGRYPQPSRLMIVSIGARRSDNGRAVDLDHTETDAWATALAPEGFGQYMIRLGVMAGSTGRAVHYRYILGPDHRICAVDTRDAALMRGGYQR